MSSSSSSSEERDDEMEDVDSDEGGGSQAEETDGEEEEVDVREDQVEDAPVPTTGKRRASSVKTASSSKKPRNAAIPRRFEFSVTIVLKGEDIDAERVEPLLDDFIKQHTERAIVCFERGDVEKHLHVQACMVVITTTPQQFKLQIERALGYEKGSRPVNLSICLRQLTGKGLHTVQGLVGYCRKAKDAVDFREITHNITDQDKAAGDLLFILHGKTETSKTKVSLTGRNIISKMLVFLKYKTKTILRHTRDPLCLLLKMVSEYVLHRVVCLYTWRYSQTDIHTHRCGPVTTNSHPSGFMSGEDWTSYGSTVSGKATSYPKISKFRILSTSCSLVRILVVKTPMPIPVTTTLTSLKLPALQESGMIHTPTTNDTGPGTSTRRIKRSNA